MWELKFVDEKNDLSPKLKVLDEACETADDGFF